MFVYGNCGCIEENESSSYYVYDIKFTPDDDQIEYYLILPFPIYKNQSNPKIIEELNKSNINYKIELTNFGRGLNISYISDLKILIEEKPNREMLEFELSLLNDTIHFDDGYYFIYSSIKGSIEYKFKVRTRGQENYYNIKSDLNAGWQSVKATVWEEID